MPWIWSCHKCHTRYLLGATRRCLQDGHYFCGGTTVDNFSGKVRKHRACISEFDYSGWEDFSRWKRATTGPVVRLGRKHCEDECDFPSSCHWKEQYAVQERRFAYPDPGSPYMEADAPSVEDNTRRKVRRARINGTIKVANLTPIEEEEQKASSFPNTVPDLNGLGLHYPVMEFSSSKNGRNESSETADKAQLNLPTPKSPQMSARVDSVWEDDVDMTDFITQNATESAPIFLGAQPEFDFGLEQDDGHAECLADDVLSISPMRSTWDLGIGVALLPPEVLKGDVIQEEELEEGVDDTRAVGQMAKADRRHGC